MIDFSSPNFLLHWLVAGLAVLLTSRLIRGFEISGIVSALVAALVIGFLNALLWPLLFVLTLPINLLTLGLFTFVLNGIILKVSAALLPGFKVEGWFSAIFGAVVLSVISLILHSILV